ncbi:MAG: type II toxin-antitoxin system VapC family toxin [Deltaproteobacteria bacterium]|nr:type II toxin-antitoxin system VapC family toxin [Deltaproteobacteria bacterium]
MKLVLDTNIYTDYAEGLPDVVEILAMHGTQIFIPSIVLGELHYGFMKGRNRQLNEAKLNQFITHLKVKIIDVDDEVARKYATIMVSLSKKGTKIPINDVWIAACCMNAGGTLFTRDRHFDAIDQLDKIVP